MKTFGSRVLRGWVPSLAMLGASMAFVPLYDPPSSDEGGPAADRPQIRPAADRPRPA
jgi:hypothetical protein